jgi:hypothetical protein
MEQFPHVTAILRVTAHFYALTKVLSGMIKSADEELCVMRKVLADCDKQEGYAAAQVVQMLLLLRDQLVNTHSLLGQEAAFCACSSMSEWLLETEQLDNGEVVLGWTEPPSFDATTAGF